MKDHHRPPPIYPFTANPISNFAFTMRRHWKCELWVLVLILCQKYEDGKNVLHPKHFQVSISTLAIQITFMVRSGPWFEQWPQSIEQAFSGFQKLCIYTRPIYTWLYAKLIRTVLKSVGNPNNRAFNISPAPLITRFLFFMFLVFTYSTCAINLCLILDSSDPASKESSQSTLKT